MELVKKYCACGCGMSWKAYPTSPNKYFGEDHKQANNKRKVEKKKVFAKDYEYNRRLLDLEHLRQSLGEAYLYA